MNSFLVLEQLLRITLCHVLLSILERLKEEQSLAIKAGLSDFVGSILTFQH